MESRLKDSFSIVRDFMVFKKLGNLLVKLYDINERVVNWVEFCNLIGID